MTTMAQALAAVRIRLDESTATAWTDPEIRGWINEGVNDIARRTESVIKTATVATTANTAEYNLPAAILRVNRVVWVGTGTDFRTLEIREFNELDSAWHGNQTASGDPIYFGLSGYPPYLKARLFPIPTSAGTLSVTYYAIPAAPLTDGTQDSTALEIPAGWDDLVYEYATYLAQRRDGNPAWQDAKREYEQRILDMIDMTRHFHDQPSQIVPDMGLGFGDVYGSNWGW